MNEGMSFFPNPSQIVEERGIWRTARASAPGGILKQAPTAACTRSHHKKAFLRARGENSSNGELYGPAGLLDLWLQLDVGDGRGKGKEVEAGAQERKHRHNFESETEEDTQRGRDIHPERPSIVDRDRVGEGKEGRHVFELAANSANPWGFSRDR